VLPNLGPSFQCALDIGSQFLRPPGPVLLVTFFELSDNSPPKELQRFADMIVLVRAGLLQQDQLINAGSLEVFEVRADIVGRTDCSHSGHGEWCRGLELLPQVRDTRPMPPNSIVMCQRPGKEPLSLETAIYRGVAVSVAKETVEHRHFRIYRLT